MLLDSDDIYTVQLRVYTKFVKVPSRIEGSSVESAKNCIVSTTDNLTGVGPSLLCGDLLERFKSSPSLDALERAA